LPFFHLELLLCFVFAAAAAAPRSPAAEVEELTAPLSFAKEDTAQAAAARASRAPTAVAVKEKKEEEEEEVEGAVELELDG